MTLDDWLSRCSKGGATRLAVAVGTTRQTISHLRHGDMPSVRLAVAIAAATGGEVSVTDWPSKPRKKRRAA